MLKSLIISWKEALKYNAARLHMIVHQEGNMDTVILQNSIELYPHPCIVTLKEKLMKTLWQTNDTRYFTDDNE